MIYWSQFDWSSFATLVGAGVALVVGILAVIGAVRVGNKQVAIVAKQSEILDRQVALQEAGLRAELFDRRMAVYEAAIDFLHHLSDSINEEPGKGRLQTFVTKYRESQFLFGPEVHAAMNEIAEKGNDLRATRNAGQALHKKGLLSKSEIEVRFHELISWSLERARTLHEVFRPELELSYQGLMQPS